MTENEARGYIQGKLNCMNKCGIFNKEDNNNDNDCDNCDYCYSQGNFGNQKKAFELAINALELNRTAVYNKAIDDFMEKVELKYLGVHPDEMYEKYYPYEICKQLKKIAEQLKAGDRE